MLCYRLSCRRAMVERQTGTDDAALLQLQEMRVGWSNGLGAQLAHFCALARFAHKLLQARERCSRHAAGCVRHRLCSRRGQIGHTRVDWRSFICIDASRVAGSAPRPLTPRFFLSFVGPLFSTLRSADVGIDIGRRVFHMASPVSYFRAGWIRLRGTKPETDNPSMAMSTTSGAASRIARSIVV